MLVISVNCIFLGSVNSAISGTNHCFVSKPILLHDLLFRISSHRRHGDDSDAESSRETSSDGSSDYGAERGINGVVDNACRQNIADVNGHGWNRGLLRDKPLTGSSSDESESCNPPGQLVFQYLEHDQPFGREPLADKASIISERFTKLNSFISFRKCFDYIVTQGLSLPNRFKFLHPNFQS